MSLSSVCLLSSERALLCAWARPAIAEGAARASLSTMIACNGAPRVQNTVGTILAPVSLLICSNRPGPVPRYSIALTCVVQCMDPHFRSLIPGLEMQSAAEAVTRQLFSSRPGVC